MTTQDIDARAGRAGETVAENPQQRVRWSVPIALFACVLLAFFDKISIAALFSDAEFQQALGIGFDPARLGLLMSAFLFSYGMSSMLLSGIGDRLNPVKVLIGMMVVWGVLMVLMGLVRSYHAMMTLRILLGIAEGPLLPMAYAIIRQAFPPQLQARATMLWLLGTPLGAALGFPVTLYILNTFDWQATFFFMAFLTLPVMLLVLFGMRHLNVARPAAAAKPAVSERQQHRRELLRSPHFWMICLFNIAFLTYLWGMNGWLPSYLIKGKGIHLEHAGYLSSLPFIAMLLGEVLGAWLSDKLDWRAGLLPVAVRRRPWPGGGAAPAGHLQRDRRHGFQHLYVGRRRAEYFRAVDEGDQQQGQRHRRRHFQWTGQFCRRAGVGADGGVDRRHLQYG